MSLYRTKVRPVLAKIYDRSPFRSFDHYYRNMRKLLVKELKGKTTFEMLEVGSLHGWSAGVWGKQMNRADVGHLTCVDLWTKDEDFELFKKSIEHCKDRVTPIKGNSSDVLPTLPKEKYDFIFIDGGHEYSQVKQDILDAIPLVKDGGILSGHDLDLQLHEVDANEAAAHKEEDTAFHKGIMYHPGVSVAIAEIFGKLDHKERMFWVFRKQGSEWQNV
jgi:predicted O-methyltransferase YrrM